MNKSTGRVSVFFLMLSMQRKILFLGVGEEIAHVDVSDVFMPVYANGISVPSPVIGSF